MTLSVRSKAPVTPQSTPSFAGRRANGCLGGSDIAFRSASGWHPGDASVAAAKGSYPSRRRARDNAGGPSTKEEGEPTRAMRRVRGPLLHVLDPRISIDRWSYAARCRAALSSRRDHATTPGAARSNASRSVGGDQTLASHARGSCVCRRRRASSSPREALGDDPLTLGVVGGGQRCSPSQWVGENDGASRSAVSHVAPRGSTKDRRTVSHRWKVVRSQNAACSSRRASKKRLGRQRRRESAHVGRRRTIRGSVRRQVGEQYALTETAGSAEARSAS